MFKWPGVPSPRAPHHELSDFAELLCWQRGSVSIDELSHDLGRLAENDYTDGVPEEEEIPNDIESAFEEIGNRIVACNGGYPFEFVENGNVLRRIEFCGNNQHLVYRYLLLATRLNMTNNRTHEGIDGTSLLEHLSAMVARRYLGRRARSMIFGTSELAFNFPRKIQSLCNALGEGQGFSELAGTAAQVKDDKLDVVAWKPFSDQREGKLIAFGQCKTGTNWKSSVSQLQPDKFCNKWFKSQPVHTPVRMFFVSEALPSIDWRTNSIDAGLLFDRCRIVDYASNTDKTLTRNLLTWIKAASQATELPSPFY